MTEEIKVAEVLNANTVAEIVTPVVPEVVPVEVVAEVVPIPVIETTTPTTTTDTTTPKKSQKELQGEKEGKVKKINKMTAEAIRKEINRMENCGHKNSAYYTHLRNRLTELK